MLIIHVAHFAKSPIHYSPKNRNHKRITDMIRHLGISNPSYS